MSREEASKSDTHRRPPLPLIYSLTLTGILANTLVNAPLPDILEHFGEPERRAGLLVAAVSLPGVLAAPVIGVLADRFGRRAVLLPCLTLFGVAGLAGAAAGSFDVLVASRIVQGFGSAGLINLAVVLIADHWEGAERVRLIGRNAAVLTVSVAVFPPVGGILAELGGWRWSFAPYVVGLFAAVGVAFWLPHDAPRHTAGLRAQLRDAAAVVRRPELVWSLVWSVVAFAVIFGCFLTAMPLHLDEEFGLGPAARGFVLAAPAAGATIAALSVGRTRARLGAAKTLLVGTVLFAVGFGSIAVAGVVALVLVGAFVYGLGEGCAIPTVQDRVSSAAPDASRGMVVACFVSATRLGQTVGPLVAGGVVEAYGARAAFGSAAVLVAVMALALAVAGPRDPEVVPAA